jgi:hypothetical protein
MTQKSERRKHLTEREKLDTGFYVPFFARERGKSFEGQVFTPYFRVPAAMDINSSKRHAAQTR